MKFIIPLGLCHVSEFSKQCQVPLETSDCDQSISGGCFPLICFQGVTSGRTEDREDIYFYEHM